MNCNETRWNRNGEWSWRRFVMCGCLMGWMFCSPMRAIAGGPPAATQPAAARPATRPANPTPTMANVAYGTHARQVMDFWKAPSDKPTPLLFYIHGGGWEAGDKQGARGVARYLAAGISVVLGAQVTQPARALEPALRALMKRSPAARPSVQ